MLGSVQLHETGKALARVMKHHLPCAFLPSAKALTGANVHICKFPKLSAIATENSLKQPTEGRGNMSSATRGCAGFFPSTSCSHVYRGGRVVGEGLTQAVSACGERERAFLLMAVTSPG